MPRTATAPPQLSLWRAKLSAECRSKFPPSFVEREHLSLRMGSRRFTRLTNGFSKRLDNHVAAVSLYVMHYNFCRVHETASRHRTTPRWLSACIDRPMSIGELWTRLLKLCRMRPRLSPLPSVAASYA